MPLTCPFPLSVKILEGWGAKISWPSVPTGSRVTWAPACPGLWCSLEQGTFGAESKTDGPLAGRQVSHLSLPTCNEEPSPDCLKWEQIFLASRILEQCLCPSVT